MAVSVMRKQSNRMGYTREDIIRECKKEIANISTFYKQDFINYRGKTSDTDEYFTEVVAEFICDHVDEFDNIKQISRKSPYKLESHDGEYDETSNREEEITAMQMFNYCKDGSAYDFIGQIIDYQTPLKNSSKDKAGKVDLLSVKDDTMYVLELKKKYSKETMLRCVMEGYTYLKTVDKEKLIEDFGKEGIVKKVYASPLVFRKMSQWKEMQENRPQLFRLMKLLESKVFYIDDSKEGLIIRED